MREGCSSLVPFPHSLRCGATTYDDRNPKSIGRTNCKSPRVAPLGLGSAQFGERIKQVIDAVDATMKMEGMIPTSCGDRFTLGLLFRL